MRLSSPVTAAALSAALLGCGVPDELEIGTTRQAVGTPNCSAVTCTSADQPTQPGGFKMFSEDNFNAVVDGFGITRQFYVHIPDDYDTINTSTQKIPLVFAFHGGGESRQDMIAGKWGDFFDQNVAFVIPLGTVDPCDTQGLIQWLSPGIGNRTLPNANCPSGTSISVNGTTQTYWNASIPGTFNDVNFIDSLRTTILARFPKLNPRKVYATGFSSGGGLAFALACYRSAGFRAFSVVGRMMTTASGRGTPTGAGTDANSLMGTCGSTQFMAGPATGITAPQLWGYGSVTSSETTRLTKPFMLVGGEFDSRYTVSEFASTRDEILDRNNLLSNVFAELSPFAAAVDQSDNTQTTRRVFVTEAVATQRHTAYRGYFVDRQNDSTNSGAEHAVPDVDRCTGRYMTCDWNYTTETKSFFDTHADLNLDFKLRISVVTAYPTLYSGKSNGTPTSLSRGASTNNYLSGFTMKEVSDDPCYFSASFHDVGTNASAGSEVFNKCNGGSPGDTLSDTMALSGYLSTGVAVCLNSGGDKIKGFALVGRQASCLLDPYGKTSTGAACNGRGPRSDAVEERLNCPGSSNGVDGDWEDVRECPMGSVLTGIEVNHIASSGGRRMINGVKALCHPLTD